ncbi:MAG: hypothetical protein KGI08_09735 [Thaumarchaeota archaeon]|nr:hypothetical protein [Nitrososphaerota archaeon]
MKHVHGMIVFGIIFSILALPFYVGGLLGGGIGYLIDGVIIQLVGAILIGLSKKYHAKLKNMPSR